MSFIRGAAATVPVINGIDANAYINTLPNVPSRPNCKRPPMCSTNRSADAGMLSVAGGSKPVVIKQPVPPPKSAALPTMHWTQRNASAAAGVQPSARSGGSVRARSVDTSHGRGSALSAAATASVSSSLSLTASHMSPIKQSLKGYQMDIARSKPETSKDVVEEMQRKAKLRADSWKRQLLADANSVPACHCCILRISLHLLPLYASSCAILSPCVAKCCCFQAEAQREAARKQKEQVCRPHGGNVSLSLTLFRSGLMLRKQLHYTGLECARARALKPRCR